MMLDFNDAKISLTADDILQKISEYDIFKFYCKNFIDIDKSFCSDLRIDNNPGCRIYLNSNNQLKYKDFASGDNYNCWNYVMNKFNCTYYEALNIISNDFNLSSIKTNIEPRLILTNDEFKTKIANIPKEKSIITIVEQPWSIIDYNYWNQFGITFDILDEFNVFSAKYVYLNKGNRRLTFEYKKSNPCYAYRFTGEGRYSYKIYFPNHPDKKYKWLFSGGSSSDIEGYDQLPLNGDILILTKSLKDCMCYRVLGYSAISLQGEGNKLEQSLVDKLLKRFDKIVINYDCDSRGILETNKLVEQYNFNCFYIDKHKDLSDYIKNEGLDRAKILIDGKIKNCI
jgi:hypothetical protein